MALDVRTRWRLGGLALATLLTTPLWAAPPTSDPYRTESGELIGKPALPWQVEHWINSRPLELSDLRGRVVLLRFWTAPGCPYCRATAPALNELHRRYRDRGLTVIGFYHHKAQTPLDPLEVEQHARAFGFEFPVAIDREWTTLHGYWLDHAPRAFTSVSFLIDRAGVIRYIHSGGQYTPGDAAFREIEARIQRLCAEPPPDDKR